MGNGEKRLQWGPISRPQIKWGLRSRAGDETVRVAEAKSGVEGRLGQRDL